jgi:hypothetical protein
MAGNEGGVVKLNPGAAQAKGGTAPGPQVQLKRSATGPAATPPQNPVRNQTPLHATDSFDEEDGNKTQVFSRAELITAAGLGQEERREETRTPQDAQIAPSQDIMNNIAEWGKVFHFGQQSLVRFIGAASKATSEYTDHSQHANLTFIFKAVYESADQLEKINPPQAATERAHAIGGLVFAIENKKFKPYMLFAFRKIMDTYALDTNQMQNVFRSFSDYLTKWEAPMLTQKIIDINSAVSSLSEISNKLLYSASTMRCDEPMVAYLEQQEIRNRIDWLIEYLAGIRKIF